MASLKDIINCQREETLQRYLAAHQEILLSAFCPMAMVLRKENSACFAKYRFGSDYVSDFILVTCGSFVCDAVLVELEPSTARLFTSSGSFAQRLNGAYQQVTDWLSWVNEHRDYFRTTIVSELNKHSKHELANAINGPKRPRLLSTAKIIIGQRCMLSTADDQRRAELYQRTARSIEVLPYDRLIDIEEVLRK